MIRDRNTGEGHITTGGTEQSFFPTDIKSGNTMPFFSMETGKGNVAFFRRHQDEWRSILTDVSNTVRNYTLHTATNTFILDLIQGIKATLHIYDTWLESIDRIGGNFLKLAHKVERDGRLSLDDTFNTIFSIISIPYNTESDYLIASLKAAPFNHASKAVEEMNAAIQDATSSFPDHFKQASIFFINTCETYIKIINFSTLSIRDTGKIFSHIHIKDYMHAEGYRKRLANYGTISKDAVNELLESLLIFSPGLEDMIDSLRSWAHTYFDLLVSWFDISVRLAQGIGKSLSDLYIFAYEKFIAAKVPSPGEFAVLWTDLYKKIAYNFAYSTQFFTTLSGFVTLLFAHAKSTTEVHDRLKIFSFFIDDKMNGKSCAV